MPNLLIIDRNSSRRSALASRLNDVPGLGVQVAKEELSTVYGLHQTRPDVILLGTDNGDSWMISLLKAAVPYVPVIAYVDRWDVQAQARASSLGAAQLLSSAATRGEFLTAMISVLPARVTNESAAR